MRGTPNMKTARSFLAVAALCAAATVTAAEPATEKPEAPKTRAAKAPPKNPAPTQADVRYGEHERNVLDFWKAETDKPAPLLFFIHGGGWVNGDKSGIAVAPFLKAGISVVSINYRYTSQAA